MSRGAGWLMREVEAFLASEPAGRFGEGFPRTASVREIASHAYSTAEPTRAQIVATRRALHQLARQGRARVWVGKSEDYYEQTWHGWRWHGTWRRFPEITIQRRKRELKATRPLTEAERRYKAAVAASFAGAVQRQRRTVQ